MSSTVCRLSRLALGLICLAGVLGGTGCVSEPNAVSGGTQAYGYTWQQELQLGAQSDEEILDQMGAYPDDAVQGYVRDVAQRVLAQSDFRDADAPEIYRDTKFTFRVLDTPVVNAFALPGGYVYVTRGLLAHLDNEAQLSVVLGHEIGHVVARHASRQALRAQIGQLGLLAGAIIGEEILPEHNIGSQILDLGGSAFQLLLFRYSRDAEREADKLGVRYAGASGYAAGESAAFFRSLERISARAGSRLPEWQSTHPDPGERAETVRTLGAAATPVGGGPPEVGTDALLDHVDGLVFGDDPRQGYRDGDTFYHPELRLQLPIPPGWKMQNERAMVLFSDPGGAAVAGMQLVKAANAHEAAAAASRESGIQPIAVQDTTIGSLPATILVADASTSNGVVRTYAAFIDYDGRVYNILGQAAAANFLRFQPVFEATVRGFRPLTDRRRLDVQPAHVQVITADRAAPFREFLPANLPSGVTPEELAIVNQLELDTAVQPGRKLKIVK